MAKKKPIKYSRGIIRPTEFGTFLAEVYFAARRHRRTLKTLAQARAWIDALVAEIESEEVPLSGFDVRDAHEAKKFLPPGVSLLEAVKCYLSQHPLLTEIPLAEAVDQFLEDQARANLRPRTVQQYRSHLKQFVGDFGPQAVSVITTPALIAWLNEREISGRTRSHYRTSFSAFWTWCERVGFATTNPARAITTHRVDETLPEVFTVDQAARLLHAAEKVRPDMCPYLAVGLFAGVRPATIERLTWSDVVDGYVSIGPEAAKTRDQNYVTILDNLAVWLKRYRGKGRLTPVEQKQRYGWLHRIRGEAGIKVWPHDGMRHSFCTYHLALFQNAPLTAAMLCHRETGTLFRHYRNKATREEGEAYFQIVPGR